MLAYFFGPPCILFINKTILHENRDCPFIVGGDFNVDFAATWKHTELPKDFCDKSLFATICQPQ